ncbi:GNAT family N-acetyltransferase [Xylella fastidiosa subsp. morus]|uniref:GNAT family N-acetyltransferase n=1 Tax=Xylella fastidiosa TaxID=2371 RepID=UPI0003ECDBB7|nr:GNAT family N-acetyltransferase [Xylella fastidiosa]AIC13690.1 N-acetyltransferase GCN5 [Xylella fastidiosa MUL0034]EWG14305.1 hypothetical protein P910_002510 [Xylella fastidiosa Mul-MD]UIN27716.1 GNAT family N-acetyltransferase [Xylella fastidiosa subsp. morus]UIT35758.1 GNAT family N-acetyltransferase [Xylella fastidiosa subsp. morus]UIT38049.1 GNAT family N-acetyltransferase [Xylella fastidiosa subsp. morus]
MNIVVQSVYDNTQEFEIIKKWRENYICINPANENDFEYWESIREDCSYSFYFYYEDQLVGGVRLTPLGHGITMGERQLDLLRFISVPLETLEVNRLVIEERARGKKIMYESLQYCFHWASRNTTHSELIALCLPRMVPLYRRVGATMIHENLRSKEMPEKEYSLISINLKGL